MAKTKKDASPKTDKKAIRQQVENALTANLTEMLNGREVSKQLHKKIKKAGKLLVEGLLENTKSAAKPAKKSSPKKAAPKKAVPKKAVSKKPL
jgi:hypothetical protein